MPNWCENELRIGGPPEDLKRFFEIVVVSANHREDSDEPSILMAFHPLPYAIEHKGGDAWYDWCVKHWGTKWPEHDGDFQNDGLEVWFHFLSAWAPPTEGYRYVSSLWPTLTFDLRYAEPGIGFRGVERIKQGTVEIIHNDDEWTYPDQVEDDYMLPWPKE